MATKKKGKPSPQAKKAAARPAPKAKPAKAPKAKKAAPRPQQAKPAASPRAGQPGQTTTARTAGAALPRVWRSTIRQSVQPSGALSRSIPTPSGGSPTNGGIRYLTVQDLVDLHRAVSV